MAALFFVQSPPALIGTVTVPGSQMVMALQAVLLGGWCAGTVPMDVVLAPLPAVAVYIAVIVHPLAVVAFECWLLLERRRQLDPAPR